MARATAAQQEPIQGTEKEFLTRFEKLCYARAKWQVWSDLMTMFACSLSNVADRRKEHYEKREKEYLQIIGRYEKEEQLMIPEMLGVITMALENNPDQDFLGKLYMNLDLGSHWHGQFFTPYSICQMMSKISLNKEAMGKDVNRAGFASINDPACGAGATLIAAYNEGRRAGFNPQTQMFFVGQDIDTVAASMCYIQMSLLGAAGYVCIGNTLTNPCTGRDVLLPVEKEGQDIWFTPMYNNWIWYGRCRAREMDLIARSMRPKFWFDFEKGEVTYGRNHKG